MDRGGELAPCDQAILGEVVKEVVKKRRMGRRTIFEGSI